MRMTMKKELDEKLCADYPELYSQRHGDMRETCMCWGFDCEDGWYDLIDTLSFLLSSPVGSLKESIEHIKERIEEGNLTDWEHKYYNQPTIDKKQQELEEAIKNVPVAVQVKEKFGTLRFYTDKSTKEQDAYISFAENMSAKICEVCGKPGQRNDGGWIRTLCPEHSDDAESVDGPSPTMCNDLLGKPRHYPGR
jgi:hypothetical protein